MELTVYLSGEIHTDWRDEIMEKCRKLKLPIEFLSPITNHELSDDVGIKISGKLVKTVIVINPLKDRTTTAPTTAKIFMIESSNLSSSLIFSFISTAQ